MATDLGYVDREDDTLVYYATPQAALAELARDLIPVRAGRLVTLGHGSAPTVYPANSRGQERRDGARRVVYLTAAEIERCRDMIPLVCVSGDEYWTNGPSLRASNKRPGQWYVRHPK